MVQGLNLDLRSEFFTIWLSVNHEPWTSVPAESSISSQLSSLCGRRPVHAAFTAQVKDHEPVVLQHLPSIILEASPRG